MIVITGAGGRLGGRVARLLGDGTRLVVRDASRAPSETAAVASYDDFDAVRRALSGADVVFRVPAAEAPDRVDHHRAFVDAAVAAGAGHIVYTSFVGAAPDAVFTLGRDHWATEEHIRASGLPFTFLRDNPYADVLPPRDLGRGVRVPGLPRRPALAGRGVGEHAHVDRVGRTVGGERRRLASHRASAHVAA